MVFQFHHTFAHDMTESVRRPTRRVLRHTIPMRPRGQTHERTRARVPHLCNSNAQNNYCGSIRRLDRDCEINKADQGRIRRALGWMRYLL